ncbi:hypothetical protein RR42_s1797 [Cupriavidus basilensis]|uniref:Uncharacterized protein n=1 Tax=Cupriavidus basilensis TaxID=68895 RepID=A0A0C4YLD7_9BURK|nr:hypothetical protein RR42_s1797 [Cupriavidus basilensis]
MTQGNAPTAGVGGAGGQGKPARAVERKRSNIKPASLFGK